LRDYQREIATILEVTKRFPCNIHQGSPSSVKTLLPCSVDDELPF
jgi:hypothetical protein